MSNNEKRPYSVANEKANCIVKAIAPFCERVEIAGSLRRKKNMIGDIEIVALPIRQKNLFGEPAKGATALDGFFSEHDVDFVRNGDLYKQFSYGGMMVDLFLPASAAHWGCVYMIRTGSHEFNMWVMSQRSVFAGVKFEKGLLYKEGDVIDTQTETAVFKALQLDFVKPEDRDNRNNWVN